MAEPHLTVLTQIIDNLGIHEDGGATLEAKHFFSGAALYANGKIVASLSPAGFALKLPPDIRNRLINEGAGTEFRFFASGPVKREYVALSDSAFADDDSVRQLLKLAIKHVTKRDAESTTRGPPTGRTEKPTKN